jgi:hypothetical protein
MLQVWPGTARSRREPRERFNPLTKKINSAWLNSAWHSSEYTLEMLMKGTTITTTDPTATSDPSLPTEKPLLFHPSPSRHHHADLHPITRWRRKALHFLGHHYAATPSDHPYPSHTLSTLLIKCMCGNTHLGTASCYDPRPRPSPTTLTPTIPIHYSDTLQLCHHPIRLTPI